MISSISSTRAIFVWLVKIRDSKSLNRFDIGRLISPRFQRVRFCREKARQYLPLLEQHSRLPQCPKMTLVRTINANLLNFRSYLFSFVFNSGHNGFEIWKSSCFVHKSFGVSWYICIELSVSFISITKPYLTTSSYVFPEKGVVEMSQWRATRNFWLTTLDPISLKAAPLSTTNIRTALFS